MFLKRGGYLRRWKHANRRKRLSYGVTTSTGG
jgi:hypothetical protein